MTRLIAGVIDDLDVGPLTREWTRAPRPTKAARLFAALVLIAGAIAWIVVLAAASTTT